MMITKDNYRAHEEYCDECFTNVQLTYAEIHTNPDRDDLWQVCCPQCGEPLLHFWKEEPNWDVLTPGTWTATHWDTLQQLQELLAQPPKESAAHLLPPLIDSVSHQVFPKFFESFDWPNWSLGIHLSKTDDLGAFQQLDFAKALALLFALYRADRFAEGLLLERWEKGVLSALVNRLVSFRS